MSPLFETDAHRDDERRIAAMLSEAWECRMQMTSSLADVDFYAYRGVELFAVGEIKSRNVASTHYGRCYFDVDKATRLREIAAEYGVVPVIVLEYLDGIFTVDPRALRGVLVQNSRRKDRGDADREQPAYVFDTSMLRRLAP